MIGGHFVDASVEPIAVDGHRVENTATAYIKFVTRTAVRRRRGPARPCQHTIRIDPNVSPVADRGDMGPRIQGWIERGVDRPTASGRIKAPTLQRARADEVELHAVILPEQPNPRAGGDRRVNPARDRERVAAIQQAIVYLHKRARAIERGREVARFKSSQLRRTWSNGAEHCGGVGGAIQTNSGPDIRRAGSSAFVEAPVADRGGWLNRRAIVRLGDIGGPEAHAIGPELPPAI